MEFDRQSSQFLVLFRHFFSRLSYNELLKFEDQQRESRVVMLVILAVAGGVIAHVILEPFLLYGLFEVTPADLWHSEFLLLTLSMILTGVVAVFSWDKLFLDRLDRLHFLSLPVEIRTLFWAKTFSLLAFAVATATIGNFFSTLIASAYPAELLGGLFIGGWAHYAANQLCSIFVFMAVALFHGLVLILFPSGLGKRIAVFMQMLLLIVFLSPFVWYPMLFDSLPALKTAGSAFFHFYPPLWFAGVFNRIINVPDPVLDQAGRSGLVATALLLLAYFLISPFCLRKFVRGYQTMPALNRKFLRFPGCKRLFNVVYLRHPLQMAVFHFFKQTLRRSREHKIRFTLFLALPISFLLSRFPYLFLHHGFSRNAFNSLLASMPLLLHFFLIIGMRMVVAYPHTLSANFVFRIGTNEPLSHYMSSVRKALIGSIVLPPLFVSFSLYLFFWPLGQTVLYLLFSMSIAMLFLELCFFDYFRVPFAAEHVPGKFKLRYYWPVLLIGGYIYYSAFSALGNSLLHDPKRYPVTFLLAALFYTLLRLRRGDRMKGERLVFEEEPEQAMITLGFD